MFALMGGPERDKHSVLARLDDPDCLFSGTPGRETQFCFFVFFFQTVVWIKWMNIFRPAYFTPRHWRERGRGLISLSGQTAEWKESIRCGRREKIGGDREDPAVSESH